MSIDATSRCSVASITDVNNTALVDTVGEDASTAGMVPRCLSPPATMRPLIVRSRFSFRNRCDSRAAIFSSEERSLGWTG
jgi:hypothetical protein